MEATGTLKGVAKDLTTNNWIISFETSILPSLEDISGGNALDITAKRHREKRSKNANALLWECLGRIAAHLGTDKWSVYLLMLKRYGVYTLIDILPAAFEMLKRQWRECEEIGTIDVNGEELKQVLCYYGSSTYDTKQFSVLLDGVISEMKEMNIETPTSEQMKHALEQWEKQNEKQEIKGM